MMAKQKRDKEEKIKDEDKKIKKKRKALKRAEWKSSSEGLIHR